MSVYVDNYEAAYRGMKMCHMVADTTEELLAMVDKIGVKRKWIQYPGTYNEHFDICLAKKKLALAAGAVEISARDYAKFANARKNNTVFTPSPLHPVQNSFF
jgi:hypothetical protein